MGAYKKTEHTGAKDSGRKSGYLGYRHNAKRWAKKVRRENDRKEVEDGRTEAQNTRLSGGRDDLPVLSGVAEEGESAASTPTPEADGQEGGGIEHTTLPEVQGSTILSVTGLTENSPEVLIRTTSGTIRLHHFQECCEAVFVEDVTGDPEDIVGARIHEFRISSKADPDACVEGWWHLYTVVTDRADVTIRWYGESNGWYSTDVICDFAATVIPALFATLEDAARRLAQRPNVNDGLTFVDLYDRLGRFPADARGDLKLQRLEGLVKMTRALIQRDLADPATCNPLRETVKDAYQGDTDRVDSWAQDILTLAGARDWLTGEARDNADDVLAYAMNAVDIAPQRFLVCTSIAAHQIETEPVNNRPPTLAKVSDYFIAIPALVHRDAR